MTVENERSGMIDADANADNVDEGTPQSWSNSFATGLARIGISPAPVKMSRDAMSVVEGKLEVYGVDGLRADASILPRVTTGNTMAPVLSSASRRQLSCSARYRLRPGSA
jgi:hypothetical protein